MTRTLPDVRRLLQSVLAVAAPSNPQAQAITLSDWRQERTVIVFSFSSFTMYMGLLSHTRCVRHIKRHERAALGPGIACDGQYLLSS